MTRNALLAALGLAFAGSLTYFFIAPAGTPRVKLREVGWGPGGPPDAGRCCRVDFAYDPACLLEAEDEDSAASEVGEAAALEAPDAGFYAFGAWTTCFNREAGIKPIRPPLGNPCFSALEDTRRCRDFAPGDPRLRVRVGWGDNADFECMCGRGVRARFIAPDGGYALRRLKAGELALPHQNPRCVDDAGANCYFAPCGEFSLGGGLSRVMPPACCEGSCGTWQCGTGPCGQSCGECANGGLCVGHACVDGGMP